MQQLISITILNLSNIIRAKNVDGGSVNHACRSYILTNNFNLTFNRNGVDGNNKIAVNLVDEHTTLQWHMASKHKVIEIFSFSYFVLF